MLWLCRQYWKPEHLLFWRRLYLTIAKRKNPRSFLSFCVQGFCHFVSTLFIILRPPKVVCVSKITRKNGTSWGKLRRLPYIFLSTFTRHDCRLFVYTSAHCLFPISSQIYWPVLVSCRIICLLFHLHGLIRRLGRLRLGLLSLNLGSAAGVLGLSVELNDGFIINPRIDNAVHQSFNSPKRTTP